MTEIQKLRQEYREKVGSTYSAKWEWYAEWLEKQLLIAREELSKLHQPTVSGVVCDDGTCVYGTCTEADYMICMNGCVNKQTDR